MINWIKEKLGITAMENENRRLAHRLVKYERFMIEKLAELKEYTRVDADVGIRDNNTIVLTGVYKRKAYVHFYDMGGGEFEQLVNTLREMRKHALIRTVDAPPTFRGTFDI